MSNPESTQENMLGNEPITESILETAAEANANDKVDTLPSIHEQFRLLELQAAGELLAVKDSLEAALAVPEQTVDSFKSGVELTLKQLVSAFEKNALHEVNPAGEKFDPHKHQAIGMLDSEQEANTVVSVLQKGYTIAERVLRPALVMVAKPKS